MLYSVEGDSLKSVESKWNPKELELEKYLITQDETGPKVLSESVFGEPLLLISNQVRTRAKKRADILALDRAGNGVVIELKRDQGLLGVETQALQYLADFSNYRGRNFLRKFTSKGHLTEDSILGFIGDNADIDELNSSSRVILMARSFDSTIFSLGEWLSSKGVPFRCITYTPVEIADRRLLSFSVVFDRSNEAIFPVSFSSGIREPGYFWHNIARADDDWWKFLVEKGQIPACFEDSPGDQGEKILTSYRPGDTIIAYAKGYGAVGYGVVKDPLKYRLLNVGDKDDRLKGSCRHRLHINWRSTAKSLKDGISPTRVREDFGIYHPVSTSVSIDSKKCQNLINLLKEQFSN